MFGVPTRRFRIIVQAFFLSLWVALIIITRHPIDHFLAKIVPVSFFLRIDPLVMTVINGGMRVGVTITFLGFVTLALTLLLGRVFCGWVCPFGAMFDIWGWFLRRMRVQFHRPSPRWFTLKYYLLAILMVLALLGGVSPLMGLDPIVIITRTAAMVVDPFFREQQNIIWTAGNGAFQNGYFIDVLTLILFLAIMTGTTRLSRIWCRTTCPLGAYLAISSRFATLRRDTSDCVQCGICAHHCPTGAIDFKNAEVYNESECIKCFLCSQECPVDANFFTFKAPFPARSESQQPVDLSRRNFITTAALTTVAAPGLHLSAGEPQSGRWLIRPPMSRTEHDFLASCIRCEECIKACPTGILKPAPVTEHGFRTLWSPVMVSSQAKCLPECNACSVACPTDAIMKYDVKDKYAIKAGTAVFNASLCISYSERKFCSECVRECPTDAIKLDRGWEPEDGVLNSTAADRPAPDGKIPTKPVSIIYERCVGCGACETACNTIVMGDSAMLITSYGRATPTNLDIPGGVESS